VENRDLGWSRPASGENWVPMNKLFSRIVLADQYVARNAAERNGPESHAERSASITCARNVGRVLLALFLINYNISWYTMCAVSLNLKSAEPSPE
jgi:hypothetical protein